MTFCRSTLQSSVDFIDEPPGFAIGYAEGPQPGQALFPGQEPFRGRPIVGGDIEVWGRVSDGLVHHGGQQPADPDRRYGCDSWGAYGCVSSSSVLQNWD